MSAFDFLVPLQFSDVRGAGSGGEVVGEAVVVAEGGGAELEDGFGTGGVVPEHFGAFDAVVHFFHQRLHPGGRHRQALGSVLGVLHARLVVGQVAQRGLHDDAGVGREGLLRRFTEAFLPGLQFRDDLSDFAAPATGHPDLVLVPRIRI